MLQMKRCLLASFLLLICTLKGVSGPHNVTQLSAFYRSGQVFITWQNLPDTLNYYNVYRSEYAITSPQQLSKAEYLGYTGFASAKDHQLSHHDGYDEYLSIDSGMSTLAPGTGLFVATTLKEGKYFYAVTVMKNGMEENLIIPGVNSLSSAVTEKVASARPVYQQSRAMPYGTVEIYTLFTSMKYSVDQPPMNRAGYFTTDIAVNRNPHAGLQPLRIKFHAGGSDFLTTGLVPAADEIVLSPEDFFPSVNNAAWWGSNENFDLFNDANNQLPPQSGVDYNYMQQSINIILDWVEMTMPVDTNRIYLEGTSFGAIGAFFFAMTYPERIAAVKLTVGCFNLAFQNDSNKVCTLNTGNGNRTTGDNRMGTVSAGLMSNLGYPVYNLLDGGWLAHNFEAKSFPVIYSINGKRDTMVGWTEKTMFYDSVNAYHLGGYFFFDNRTHSGNGSTWNDSNFDIFRYRKNASYPAFSDCSINEDAGNGSAASGALFGSVNGFLDWKDAVTESATQWSATVFIRDLKKSSGEIVKAPSSCNVGITPRRLQLFSPEAGDEIAWTVSHGEQIIQSGMLYYAGGSITIPDVTVFKDSVKISIVNLTQQDAIGFDTASMLIYPNPFSSTTSIRWEQTTAGKCTIRIFDIGGRWVSTLVDQEVDTGAHQVNWNGYDYSSRIIANGIYFVKMETQGVSLVRKLIVQR